MKDQNINIRLTKEQKKVIMFLTEEYHYTISKLIIESIVCFITKEYSEASALDMIKKLL